MTTLVPAKHLWLRFSAGVVACALAAFSISAQTPVSRIRAEVSSSYLTPLKDSAHPLAKAGVDAGRLAPDTQLHGMSIVFNRTPEQQADLEALLSAQQNPASPQYHQWLTPEQFGARFGMSDADIEKVKTWLEQQGFTVDSVANARNLIRFSGTSGQVERAFQTEMHSYSVQGEKKFAPNSSISVPTAIASAVAGVGNLTSLRPRPMHVRSTVNQLSPAFTSGQSGSVFFAPGDIKKVYDVNPITGTGVNGSGQSIVVVGQSSVSASDIEHFQTAAGLTVKDPTMVLVPGSGTSTAYSGDQGESDLDLEWSGAMAPGAQIYFVYVGNGANLSVFDAIQYAVDSKLGNIISVSYGACEGAISASDGNSLETIMSQGAAQGQSILAASGDSGSTTCYGISSLNTTLQQSLSVSYPASSQYVTGVGGTEISQSSAAYYTQGQAYWSAETPGSDVLTSALQYIPEVVWNDSVASVQSGGGLSAGGGGVSALFAKPSWQTGVPGIPADSHRDVPDIALYSSPEFVPYLFCTSDQTDWATGQVGSCSNGFRDSGGALTLAGGTSFATPVFAGMLAILNQDKNYSTGQGLINTKLYQLASNSGTYASAFHDIKTGNNECPSTLGATYCSSSSGAETKYSATAGYDQASGLGSIDLNNLAIAYTGSGSTLHATSTGVSANPTSVNTGDSVTFTVTVTDTSSTPSTPSGTISLAIDGGSGFGGSNATATLNGSGTATYSTSFSTAGTHSVTANYGGDSTHSTSSGVASVAVQGTSTGTGSIKVAATNVTVTDGSSGASTVTVTPSGGYTGTVTFSVTAITSGLTNACYSISNATVSGTAAITTSLTFFTNSNSCVGAALQGAGGKRMQIPGVKYKVASAASTQEHGNPIREASFGFVALLLAGLIGWRFRSLRGVAGFVAIAALGLALTACGGGSSSGGGGGGGTNAPKGTYNLTVTGTDTTTSSITATSAQFTLTID